MGQSFWIWKQPQKVDVCPNIEFFNFVSMLKADVCNIFGNFEGPGGIKKLRETCRSDFHRSAYVVELMAPRYEQNNSIYNFETKSYPG